MGLLEISQSHAIEYFIQIIKSIVIQVNTQHLNYMKANQEFINLEIGPVTRMGINSGNAKEATKVANNSLLLSSDKDRHSNKKIGDTQKMYVKEFFEHFFEKKSMLEVLSQIANGIQVLQTLVATFEDSKGVKSEDKMLFKNKVTINGIFSNIIERQGKEISESVQDLYHRLQNIFDQFGNAEEREIEVSPKPFHCPDVNGDEELYEMLNDYKADNKKQKQLRKKAETEAIEIRRQLNRAQDQKIRVGQLYKQRQLEISLSKQRIGELEERIEELNHEISEQINQKDQLTEKLTLLFEINQNLSTTQKGNIELSQKLKKSEQRELHLTKKFQALEGIVKQQIKQRDDKWMAMIQSKLTSKTLFENASCSAFRQFMGSMHTLSKC